MTRRQLLWLAIGTPALLVGAFEFTRHRWLDHQLHGFWGNALVSLVVAAGVAIFTHYFFWLVTRAEETLGRVRAEAAVLAERHRIGREMHDGVAQALFHLRVRLQEAGRRVEQGELGPVKLELERLEQTVGDAYDQVRHVISDLKEQVAVEDMREALLRGVERTATELELALRIDLAEMPPMRGKALQHLVAILSEAMSNARRHGGATAVSITSESQRLVITDNGRGFDPRQSAERAGFGLMIMAERGRMFGAEVTVDSSLGQGTRVTIDWKGAG